jgi:prolyl oligopeptidase
VLRAYSPYHNVHGALSGGAGHHGGYRRPVVPAHSFKYVAALQAGDTGDKPHLLRVESKAGHGSGKPVEKIIASGADVLSFLAYWTGLKVE